MKKEEEKFPIWYIHTFFNIHACHKSGQQSDFSEKLNSLCNQIDPNVFFGFSLKGVKTYVETLFLQHYTWMESYGCHGSFCTKISGSLIFSPVVWVLSFCISFRHGLVPLIVWEWRCFEDFWGKGSLSQIINELMSGKGVSKTAPATPAMLWCT